jgi:hypothetical protein
MVDDIDDDANSSTPAVVEFKLEGKLICCSSRLSLAHLDLPFGAS